jgi:hypothetical protein
MGKSRFRALSNLCALCEIADYLRAGTSASRASSGKTMILHILKEAPMGRGMLLWLLGIPIPIIIILALIF